jgi:hypothetical protein
MTPEREKEIKAHLDTANEINIGNYSSFFSVNDVKDLLAEIDKLRERISKQREILNDCSFKRPPGSCSWCYVPSNEGHHAYCPARPNDKMEIEL